MGRKMTSYLNYRKFFSEAGLWKKLSRTARKAGAKVVYGALLLFYASTDKRIPFSDRAKILGALGYFILPTDLIPDFLVGGFVDDLGALLWALKAVWNNITPETHEKAYKRLALWFSDVDKKDLKLF